MLKPWTFCSLRVAIGALALVSAARAAEISCDPAQAGKSLYYSIDDIEINLTTVPITTTAKGNVLLRGGGVILIPGPNHPSFVTLLLTDVGPADQVTVKIDAVDADLPAWPLPITSTTTQPLYLPLQGVRSIRFSSARSSGNADDLLCVTPKADK